MLHYCYFPFRKPLLGGGNILIFNLGVFGLISWINWYSGPGASHTTLNFVVPHVERLGVAAQCRSVVVDKTMVYRNIQSYVQSFFTSYLAFSFLHQVEAQHR